MAHVRCPYCRGEFEAGNAKTWVTCPHCEEPFHILREGATVVETPGAESESTRTDRTAGAQKQKEPPLHRRDDQGHGLEWLRNKLCDKYEVREFISRGGMGAVYHARQLKPSRDVALKVMLSADLDSDSMRRRFEREAQAAALLDHPAIVRLYEYGEVAGQPYFTMEYVKGTDLKTYVREKELDRSEICRLIIQICRAVSYAHGRGVIHRDLKPGNIIVDEQGRPRILDFGLSRITFGIGGVGQTLTMSGDVVGTPLYMSPEQALGRPDQVDRRSDIYSLGVIFYELVVGVLPYHMAQAQGLGALEILRQAQPVRPTLLHGWMPEELEAILMKALEKEKDARYQTALGMAKDIENFLADRPISARPHTWLYRLRKFAWRNRRMLGPTVIGVVATLVVGGVLAHELLSTSARARKQGKILARMEDAPAELMEMARQGKWAEAYATARYAEKNMADLPGIDGITARVERMARQEFEVRLDVVKGLIDQQNYDEATDKLKQVKTRAEDLPFEDVKARVLKFHEEFADYCQERLRESVDRAYTRTRTIELIQNYLAWSDDADNSRREEIRDLLAEKEAAPAEDYLAQHVEAAWRRLDANNWDGVAEVLQSAETLMQDETVSEQGEWDERFGKVRAKYNSVIRPGTTGRVQQVHVLGEHSGMVKGVSFSPHADELASVGLDGNVRVWGAPEWKRQALLPYEGKLWTVAWSPEGGMLAAGDNEGNVQMWVLGKEGGRKVLKYHDRRVRAVDFSHDGKLMLTASALEVKLWDVSTGEQVLLPSEPEFKMTAAFSPTKPVLAARNGDGHIELWDLDNRQKVRELVVTSRVQTIEFSPDGRRLACSDAHNTIILWDTASGKTLRTLKGDERKVWALAFSPGGRMLAGGGGENVIKLWAVQTGEVLAVLKGHDHWVMELDFSDDSRWLASCSNDQTVRIWGIPRRSGPDK